MRNRFNEGKREDAARHGENVGVGGHSSNLLSRYYTSVPGSQQSKPRGEWNGCALLL